MNTAAVPVPVEDVQGDGRWMSQHNRFIAEAKEKEPEVLFVGDSLIMHMGNSEIWRQLFEPLHCMNFGIGGDQTQHVLWRVMNGELESMDPKIIVLLVGTNNHDHTAEQVVGGIQEIIKTMHDKQPQALVIVLGLLPRGEKPNPLREKLTQINTSLSEYCEEVPNTIFFNTDWNLFLNRHDASISHHDMYDYLHLTRQGYHKMCDPLLEEIQNLLQTFVKVENTSIETSSIAGELASDRP